MIFIKDNIFAIC